jgi:uncharacterized membrane protein
MNYINIIIGILLIVIGFIFYFLEKPKSKKENQSDYMIKSFNIKIFFGILLFIILGFIMIIKELKNLF